MTFQTAPKPAPPQPQIATLVEIHGAAAVIGAVLRAMLAHRRKRRLDAAALSDHIRRDIGLTPMSQSPPLRRPPF